MKTEDLIAALAADTRMRLSVGRRSLWAVPAAVALSLAGFLLFWGLRPDLSAALGSIAVFKTLLPLCLGALAGVLALDLARPEASSGWRGAALWAFSVVILGAFGLAGFAGGPFALVTALSTPSLVTCLTSIPVLAAPVLGAVLWALSAGAPRNPARSGAVGGLAAGGCAAAVYSFYCDQDAALFFLPAYAAAIGLVVLMGAVVGARTLAW